MLNKKLFLLIFVFLCGEMTWAETGPGDSQDDSDNTTAGQNTQPRQNRINTGNITPSRLTNGNQNPSLQPNRRSAQVRFNMLQDNNQQPISNNTNQPQATASQGSDTRGIAERLDDEINNGFNWICANPLTALTGAIVGSAAFYKLFERPIKKEVNNFGKFCERKLLETLIKWEEIKEYGLTKSDYTKGLFTLLATGSLGGAIYYNGKDDTIAFIKNFFHLLNVYKIELGGILSGLILGHWLIKQKNAYDNRQSHRLNFDKFLGQLTDEQRRRIYNSDDMLLNITKGTDNYKHLLNNQEFLKLLTDTQKTYLENIVRYRSSEVIE